MSSSVPIPNKCDIPEKVDLSQCLSGENAHLTEPLPSSLVPTKPVRNFYHRIRSLAQCSDEECGQRIHLITMQGNEIRMMDTPSGACNITLTTADASQALRLDQMNKISWMTSQNHHFIMADNGHYTAGVGESSASTKYLDPNDLNKSTYQLLMTEKKHKLWMADTDTYPRIHAYTSKGHEVLLLDSSPDTPAGKIQITTYDKKMQIIMDVEKGNLMINNLHSEGTIKMYSAGKIELHAEKSIDILSKGGVSTTGNTSISKEGILPTVKSDLVVAGGGTQ